MWVQLSTTFSNVLKQPNGDLLVAVNHNQIRTMASEAVDPINWSHPLPSWAVPPERLVHSINQCNLSGNRTYNRRMRGNHLAYAATQGIRISYENNNQAIITIITMIIIAFNKLIIIILLTRTNPITITILIITTEEAIGNFTVQYLKSKTIKL